MSYMILGIHGLANKPDEPTLEAWWKKSILEGLKLNCGNEEQKIDFEIVYWAGIRYKAPIPNKNNPELYCPVKGKDTLKKYKDGWFDDVVASGLSWLAKPLDWAKQYLGVSKLADKLLNAKLKDLASYYKNPNQMEQMRDKFVEKLEGQQGKRLMVIAHSMGSIIAYDVLRSLGRERRDIQVDHFITIGSPLGLPHVKYKIWNEYNLVRTPSIVQKWTNFSDRRDPVALDVHLSDDYAPNDYNVQVKDDLVINTYKSPKGDPNYHKSYGYLRAPELSQAVRAFI